MNVSRIFIERPVMAALVTFSILLFGILGFRALPVAALPSVEFPTIAGIQSMSSTNAQGSTSITVQFELGRNIDAAAQDVQAAISNAAGQLPASMPRPPSYQKANPAEQPVLYLSLTSSTLPLY